MAVQRPEATDAAPACGPQRSGGRRRGAILLRDAKSACARRKIVARRRCGLGGRGVQPAFGQTRPSQRRRGSRARALARNERRGDPSRLPQAGDALRRRNGGSGAHNGACPRTAPTSRITPDTDAAATSGSALSGARQHGACSSRPNTTGDLPPRSPVFNAHGEAEDPPLVTRDSVRSVRSDATPVLDHPAGARVLAAGSSRR